jgi:ribosome assembly protein YihI (activator of Der GTPase)
MPQVDNSNGQHDHQTWRRFMHKLRRDELRRTCKDNGRHHLRRGIRKPGVDRQCAIDQAKGNDTDQQRDLRPGSRPKLFALFAHKSLFEN